MSRRIPGFVLWILLWLAVAAVPMSCGGGDGAGNPDADVGEAKADSMTAQG